MSHAPAPTQAETVPASLDLGSITVEEIQDWLAEQIAAQVGKEPDEIDINIPFNRYGLDSVQAMAITSLGQQEFGVRFSPLVMWNYPNIAALADYLVQELAQSEVEVFEI